MRETSLVLENREASEYIENQMKIKWKHMETYGTSSESTKMEFPHGRSPGIQLDHPPAKKKSVKEPDLRQGWRRVPWKIGSKEI